MGTERPDLPGKAQVAIGNFLRNTGTDSLVKQLNLGFNFFSREVHTTLYFMTN